MRRYIVRVEVPIMQVNPLELWSISPQASWCAWTFSRMPWNASTMLRSVGNARSSSDPAPRSLCASWPSWWSTVGWLAVWNWGIQGCWSWNVSADCSRDAWCLTCGVDSHWAHSFVHCSFVQVTLESLRSSTTTEPGKLSSISMAGWTRWDADEVQCISYQSCTFFYSCSISQEPPPLYLFFLTLC